jgi:hypothetical protein
MSNEEFLRSAGKQFRNEVVRKEAAGDQASAALDDLAQFPLRDIEAFYDGEEAGISVSCDEADEAVVVKFDYRVGKQTRPLPGQRR